VNTREPPSFLPIILYPKSTPSWLTQIRLVLSFLHGSDYLRSGPSHSVVEAAQTYFPGLDLDLLQQWWIYVDDGGSVKSGKRKRIDIKPISSSSHLPILTLLVQMTSL
jgi:hypothetical protein